MEAEVEDRGESECLAVIAGIGVATSRRHESVPTSAWSGSATTNCGNPQTADPYSELSFTTSRMGHSPHRGAVSPVAPRRTA